MNALEFLKEERRMCASFDAMCVKCPLGDTGCCVIVGDTDRELESEVAAVEQWSKAHPRRMRQSVLLERWPNCTMGDNGVVGMCPRNVDKNYICDPNRFAGCPNCRREFWMQEVE
jgi:hypothetical protein